MERPIASDHPRPILIFDSGIGGLTVLHETRLKLPHYPFYYIADDQAFPYGSWPEAELSDHIIELFAKLLAKYRPSLSIIACNTASTLALAQLRASYPQHLFVGTVPAIKPAAERTRSGLISVLATPLTINRAYTHDLIASYGKDCKISLVASSRLASYAEEYMQSFDLPLAKIEQEIRPCFREEQGLRTDIIVLACTHYPFLVNIFRKIAPWPVDWLNPAESIAQHAYNLLVRQNIRQLPAPNEMASHQQYLKASAKDRAYFTSNNIAFIKARLLQAFGLELAEFS